MRHLLLTFLLLPACGAPLEAAGSDGGGSPIADTDDGQPTEDILGGRVDQNDPAVGLVWIKGGGFCTGTLIAPTVVLTAGHCVTDEVAAFYTGTGTGSATVDRLPAAGFVEHRVIDQIAHPAYRDENACPNPTYDVGLLRLAAPLTGTRPVAIAATAPKAGARCHTVGYGVHYDSHGQEIVEQKRTATEKVLSIGETWIRVEKGSGIVDHGDSGGPLLCGRKIVGVTSCGNDPGPQHTEAYDARLDGITDWIGEQVARW